MHDFVYHKVADFFRDKEGRIILWQVPNLPLTIWLGATALSWIIIEENIQQSLRYLASAFLFTWAYLEATQGVSAFRKLLGLTILLVVIFNFFR